MLAFGKAEKILGRVDVANRAKDLERLAGRDPDRSIPLMAGGDVPWWYCYAIEAARDLGIKMREI
jgi:hypothetical protein